MDGELGAELEAACEEVGVEVSEEERDLEEHHGGVPDVGRAAEDGQHELGRHRLNKKEEGGGEEYGCAEEDDHAGEPSRDLLWARHEPAL